MKKLLLPLFLALLVYQCAIAADSKLQDLTATTTPASTDILYIVVDPGGTPLDRKVTVGNLLAVGNITGLGTGVGTFLATPSSANLAAALTDESGTGFVCMTISCVMTTPTLGVATATSVNNLIFGTNLVEQYNSTNAQTFNLYNTRTDASNYERGFMRFSSNVLQFGFEKAGTGSSRTVAIVDAAGNSYNFSGGTLFTPGGITLNTTSATLQFLSRGIIRGGATDGILLLQDYATNTTFDRLQFGGTSSSFPAIKRATTRAQCRLADDSAACAFEGKFNSSDGTVGVTVTTCTGYKDGICISGT